MSHTSKDEEHYPRTKGKQEEITGKFSALSFYHLVLTRAINEYQKNNCYFNLVTCSRLIKSIIFAVQKIIIITATDLVRNRKLQNADMDLSII